MTLSTGQLLAERYRLGRRIAVGGMGEVWEAVDSRLDRPVAVKVLRQELSGDDEFRHRFRAEARTTASLNHPGIAGVHDYGETSEQTAYLVMELVAGEPLAAVLARSAGSPRSTPSTSSSRRATLCRPRTSAGWCTATSSRATYCSPPTAR